MIVANPRYGILVYILVYMTANLLICLFYGFSFLNYEDRFAGPDHTYMHFSSMNSIEKLIYISFPVWILLNLIVLLSTVKSIYKKHKKQTV